MADIVFDDTISDDYLQHHGVKGMRWGFRKAIERIGSSVRTGRNMMANFAKSTSKRVAKIPKDISRSITKRRTRKQRKLRTRTKQLEKVAAQRKEAADLRTRQAQARADMRAAKNDIRKARESDSLMGRYRAHKNEVAARREARAAEREAQNKAWRDAHPHLSNYLDRRRARKDAEKRQRDADKAQRKGIYKRMLRNATDALIQDQLNSSFRSAAKYGWSKVANDENASEGARQFAEFMGGVKKKQDNVEDILAKKGGDYSKLSDEEITRLGKRRLAVKGLVGH